MSAMVAAEQLVNEGAVHLARLVAIAHEYLECQRQGATIRGAAQLLGEVRTRVKRRDERRGKIP
jgi:hypothetical protein